MARPVLRWQPVAAFVLSILGFGDSLYLTIEHYTGNTNLVCSATATVNCLKVTTSQWAGVFGAPVALLGLIFFTVMLAINLPTFWRTTSRWLSLLAWARVAMVLGGMGFVIYLLYRELFSIKAICLWCTGVHVVTFLLFVIIVSAAPEMLASLLPWRLSATVTPPSDPSAGRSAGQGAPSRAGAATKSRANASSRRPNGTAPRVASGRGRRASPARPAR